MVLGFSLPDVWHIWIQAYSKRFGVSTNCIHWPTGVKGHSTYCLHILQHGYRYVLWLPTTVDLKQTTRFTWSLTTESDWNCVKPGPIASDFFKPSEILVSEESSYFLITPGAVYSWKNVSFGKYYENTSYGQP